MIKHKKVLLLIFFMLLTGVITSCVTDTYIGSDDPDDFADSESSIEFTGSDEPDDPEDSQETEYSQNMEDFQNPADFNDNETFDYLIYYSGLYPVITPEVLMPLNEKITTFELAKEMRAGWNLGNTLDARSNPVGPLTVSSQETAWGNPPTSRKMIELLAETGFFTLRIPVTWERFIGTAPEYELDDRLLNRVQEIVDWAFEFDMYVIINTHHEEWNFPSHANREPAAHIMTALWRQIAARFAGYSEKLIFENMNEPRMFGTPQEWTGGTLEARDVINDWNFRFVDVIRSMGYNNEKRFLMLSTYAASTDANVLADFKVPSDNRVIASVHAYTPYDLALNTRSKRNTFDPANKNDTRDIDEMFKRLNDKLILQGTAVIMGEMGIINKDENTADRVAWTDYYTSVAADLGIPCIWWDNGIRAGSTSRATEAFALMHRINPEGVPVWLYPEIVEALLKNFK